MVWAEQGTGRVENYLEQENIDLELNFFLVNLEKIQPLLLALLIRERKHEL